MRNENYNILRLQAKKYVNEYIRKRNNNNGNTKNINKFLVNIAHEYINKKRLRRPRMYILAPNGTQISVNKNINGLWGFSNPQNIIYGELVNRNKQIPRLKNNINRAIELKNFTNIKNINKLISGANRVISLSNANTKRAYLNYLLSFSLGNNTRHLKNIQRITTALKTNLGST